MRGGVRDHHAVDGRQVAEAVRDAAVLGGDRHPPAHGALAGGEGSGHDLEAAQVARGRAGRMREVHANVGERLRHWRGWPSGPVPWPGSRPRSAAGGAVTGPPSPRPPPGSSSPGEAVFTTRWRPGVGPAASSDRRSRPERRSAVAEGDGSVHSGTGGGAVDGTSRVIGRPWALATSAATDASRSALARSERLGVAGQAGGERQPVRRGHDDRPPGRRTRAHSDRSSSTALQVLDHLQ